MSKKLIIPLIITISSILIIGLLVACSDPKASDVSLKKESTNVTVKEQDVREIAYNQLTSKDKGRIRGTWQNGKLSKITLEEGMGNINDKSYIGKEVYLVDFPVVSNSSTDNMIVYIGMDNNKLIGYGYVD